MSAAFSFYPEFISATTPVRGFFCFEGVFDGLAVGIGLHKDFFGFGVLHDDGDESVTLLEVKFV